MNIEPTVLGHPTQRQLVEFAESLVDKHVPVSALLAAHVANCPVCAEEVKKIRASFELAALARLPEPSNELTQRIIMQARQEKKNITAPVNQSVLSVSHLLQIAASIIAALALAYFSFGAAISDVGTDNDISDDTSIASSEAVTEYTIQKEAATVEALSTAVSLQHKTPTSPYDLGRRRFLNALDDDMSAARAALERNPGCARANEVMLTSVKRQLEGLRNLYLDRKL